MAMFTLYSNDSKPMVFKHATLQFGFGGGTTATLSVNSDTPFKVVVNETLRWLKPTHDVHLKAADIRLMCFVENMPYRTIIVNGGASFYEPYLGMDGTQLHASIGHKLSHYECLWEMKPNPVIHCIIVKPDAAYTTTDNDPTTVGDLPNV